MAAVSHERKHLVLVMSLGAKDCSVVIWGTAARTPSPQITNVTPPPPPERPAERRLLHVYRSEPEDSSESGLSRVTSMCLNQDPWQEEG